MDWLKDVNMNIVSLELPVVGLDGGYLVVGNESRIARLPLTEIKYEQEIKPGETLVITMAKDLAMSKCLIPSPRLRDKGRLFGEGPA